MNAKHPSKAGNIIWLATWLTLLVGRDALAHQDERKVVARLNGEPIHANEVENELKQAYGDRQLSDDERKPLFKAALDQVIDRRLVMQYLLTSNDIASEQDVAVALAQFEKELKSQNLTLEQHCEKVGLTTDDVRRSLTWKISWKRYCEKYLTPQNLEKYFDRYRREFDGTQLRVAQILFNVEPAANQTAIDAAKKSASSVREEIGSRKITFADAAMRHSHAPSRDNGGDIGLIERHGPMPEDYSKVAFALKKGEISEPFVSPFGVHLITIVDEKLGTKTWRDVESELRPAVTLYLFRWIADKQRSMARIEYLN
jgi:parvulin-like peptidyl-prolyl isomerase